MHEAETQVKTQVSFVAKVQCPHCHKEQYVEVFESNECQIEECFYCKKDIHLFLVIKTIVFTAGDCPVDRRAIKIVVGDNI